MCQLVIRVKVNNTCSSLPFYTHTHSFLSTLHTHLLSLALLHLLLCPPLPFYIHSHALLLFYTLTCSFQPSSPRHMLSLVLNRPVQPKATTDTESRVMWQDRLGGKVSGHQISKKLTNINMTSDTTQPAGGTQGHWGSRYQERRGKKIEERRRKEITGLDKGTGKKQERRRDRIG